MTKTNSKNEQDEPWQDHHFLGREDKNASPEEKAFYNHPLLRGYVHPDTHRLINKYPPGKKIPLRVIKQFLEKHPPENAVYEASNRNGKQSYRIEITAPNGDKQIVIITCRNANGSRCFQPCQSIITVKNIKDRASRPKQAKKTVKPQHKP